MKNNTIAIATYSLYFRKIEKNNNIYNFYEQIIVF